VDKVNPSRLSFPDETAIALKLGEEVYFYRYDRSDHVDVIAISLIIDRQVKNPELSLTRAMGDKLKDLLFEKQ
jgi:hypothetical protein